MQAVESIFDGATEFFLPTCLSDMIKAVDELQAAQDPPYSSGVYFVQLRQQFRTFSVLNNYLYQNMTEPMISLSIRMGYFYLDASMAKISNTKISEEYMRYPEAIAHKYPGYVLTKSYILQNKSDILIDIEELKALFCSKDIAYYEQVKDKFFGPQARFTNGKQGKSVTYCSYPRSGNTFMRKYLENITGTATGSDMVMKFTLNVALQYCGFKGEGIVDPCIWINKSHYPYRIPFDKNYSTDVSICCIRNPVDVFVSFFNFFLSQSHTGQVKQSFLKGLLKKPWEDWLRTDIKWWIEWHQTWIKTAKERKIPVYFFRFEDLIREPRGVLHDLMRFILGLDSLEGTVIERRIDDVIAMGTKANQVYKPRSGTVNKNLDKYTDEMLLEVKDKMEELIHFFGYAKGDPIAKEQNTEFFDFEGKAKQSSLDQMSGFKKLNEEMWKFRIELAKSKEDKRITINEKGSGFNMLTCKNMISYQDLLDKVEIKM